MRLFLMRHGQATNDPFENPLSPSGREDVRAVVEVFAERGGKEVSHIWHSQKTRAVQTAEIAAEVIGFGGKSETRESLAPNEPVQIIQDAIQVFFAENPDGNLLIVGHLPFLETLAHELTGLPPAKGRIVFETAALIALSLEEGSQWKLEWKLDPSSL